MDRDAAMALLGYGREWIDAGVLDDRLLELQARAALPDHAEHHRWGMWLAFADRRCRDPLTDAELESLLALDHAESHSSPNYRHPIVHDVARRLPLGRAQVERVAVYPVLGSRRALDRHLLTRAIAVETRSGDFSERLRAMQIRRWSAARTPSAIIAALAAHSPLEVMLDLASAWELRIGELLPAGAFAYGEIDAATADVRLTPLLRRHEQSWSTAPLVADALESDVISPELVTRARAAGALTIVWLRNLTGLGIGHAKHVVDALDRLDDSALLEPGVLSRAIAEAKRTIDDALLPRIG